MPLIIAPALSASAGFSPPTPHNQNIIALNCVAQLAKPLLGGRDSALKVGGASSTRTLALLRNPSIRLRKLVTIDAMCLLRVKGARGRTSKRVYSRGNDFHMFYIQARAVSAKMVNLKPVRDWANKMLICGPVCKNVSTFITNSTIAMVKMAGELNTTI